MTTIRIPASPAMRRFNAAVERADRVLDWNHDRATIAELIKVLEGEGRMFTADEVEAAYAALQKEAA